MLPVNNLAQAAVVFKGVFALRVGGGKYRIQDTECRIRFPKKNVFGFTGDEQNEFQFFTEQIVSESYSGPAFSTTVAALRRTLGNPFGAFGSLPKLVRQPMSGEL